MSLNNPEQSLFISGEEHAGLVLTSGLLHFSSRALGAELNAHQHNPSPPPLSWRVEHHPKFAILSFVTSPALNIQHLQQEGGGDLVSFKESFSLEALSSSLEAPKKENSHAFDFLWSKGNPNFSFDKTAITLFSSCFVRLSALKNQFLREEIDEKTKKPKTVLSTPLIVTGHSVGGSIASLFTLLLLDSISRPQDKLLPICITFGSPFLGDKGLQGAISQYSNWNSCFVHVVANKDPVLKLFVPQRTPQPFGSFGSPSPTTTNQQQHQPFGAYFLCSETGYTYVEGFVMVSELLLTMGSESIRNQILSQEFSMEQYGILVQHLSSKVFVKEDPQLDSSITQPLPAGIILQLEAIGDKRPLQEKQEVIGKLKEREIMSLLHKKTAMDPLKRLNEVKIKMAYLEWYKKQCKAKGVGYYDSFKNLYEFRDRDVTKHKKFLNKYWKKTVEDAEKKPQKEGANIRSTWLFAGINYRRMVEPLDIAEFYRLESNRDYVNRERSEHYKLLEQWAKEELGETTQPPSEKKKQDVAELLTEDSCFWAKVEEARVACKSYKESPINDPQKQESEVLLVDFDKYVMEEIDKYALSPEIFLEKSSFMRWWKEYEAIIGGYNSRLVRFMKNGMYNQYASGMPIYFPQIQATNF